MPGILATIKKAIGIAQEDTSFDIDLLMFINTSLLILSQIGLVEADKFPIVDVDDTWTDLLGGRADLEIVKSYIYLKVKLMFDPPTNSAAVESIKQLINEHEWRISNLKIINSINV